MQWTQKQSQCISQSDPYHYLPCKAHLTGRSAVHTSAIFTHFLSCFRSPQLHLECESLWYNETKARKVNTATLWEEAEITRYRIQYQQTASKSFQLLLCLCLLKMLHSTDGRVKVHLLKSLTVLFPHRVTYRIESFLHHWQSQICPPLRYKETNQRSSFTWS